MKKVKKSTIIPLALLIYLAFMSYIGLPYYHAGDYLYYFGIIGGTLIIIIILHFLLKKREKIREEQDSKLKK